MPLFPTLLLVACCLAGLVLVPLGFPGLWVMVLGVIAYGWLTGFQAIGAGTIALVTGIALGAELLEWWLGFRLALRYGGSRRAGWGALWGGLAGAVVGVPIPVVGSVVGGLLGSFAGAALSEYARARQAGVALRAGWGAVVGRAAAAAAKTALGLTVCVVVAFALLRSPG